MVYLESREYHRIDILGFKMYPHITGGIKTRMAHIMTHAYCVYV